MNSALDERRKRSAPELPAPDAATDANDGDDLGLRLPIPVR